MRLQCCLLWIECCYKIIKSQRVDKCQTQRRCGCDTGGDGLSKASARILEAIGEDGAAFAAQADTSLSGSKSWKKSILGSNLFQTYPALPLVGVGVRVTVGIKISQQGVGLQRKGYYGGLGFTNIEIKKEHLFRNKCLQSVRLNI